MDPRPPTALGLIRILGSGLIGALIAWKLGWPIPFLLGSLVATASVSLIIAARTGKASAFPPNLREVFIAVIGTMIGTTFSSQVLAIVPTMGITLAAMVVFVVLAQASNYAVFRHMGRYDRPTAFYSAMPGGLIEAIELGGKAGGDVETLSIQHFVRIVLVILIVPLLFFVVTGETVGSAANQVLSKSPADWQDWLAIFMLAPLGMVLGKKLRLPAAPLIGPLILTATLQATELIDLQGPSALLNVAQLVVGASLGSQFAKTTPRRLLAAFGLGLVTVVIGLALASGLALLIGPVVPMSFQTLLISFTPGGVTEMSLIALSLGVSPVIVSTHHLFRILITVALAGLMSKRLGNRPSKS